MNTNVMKNSQTSKGSSLVNPHFEIVVLWIQANIGKFIVTLLVFTYLSTALMICVSLQDALLVFGPTLSWVVAVPMAVFSQMIRGSLVYFNQANPYRVSKIWEYLGMIFAFVLTIWACYEVHHLFVSQGIGSAAQMSAIGFIIAGFFLEAYFLGEINRTNRSVLVSDPSLIEEAIAFEREYADLQIAIGEAQIELQQAKRKRLSGALQKGRMSNRQQASGPAPTPSKEEPAGDKEEDDSIIDKMADLATQPIFDFTGNGNGHAKN